MTIHVLGEIDPATHYGLKADRAVKKFDDSTASVWAFVAAEGVVGGVPLSVAVQVGVPACRRVVLRSGRLDERTGGLGVPWGWSPRGRAAFEGEAERLAAVAGRLGIELVLWPRVGDVISDIPSCLSFLRRFESGALRLLMEPAALLDGSMLPRAAEHLERIMDSFAEHPGVLAWVASDVEFVDGRPEQRPLRRGVIPHAVLNQTVARLLAIGKPIVLLDGSDVDVIKELAGAR